MYPWVKFVILRKAILTVYRSKKSNFFPCGSFLSLVAEKIFTEVPLILEIFPALKKSVLRTWWVIYLIFFKISFIVHRIFSTVPTTKIFVLWTSYYSILYRKLQVRQSFH